MKRSDLLLKLTNIIQAVKLPHPLRIGVDGIDASGKSALSDELAELLRAQGRTVIQASIDSFHHPGSIRRQRGADSPQGYFLDAYNYPAVLAALLEPLGPGGNRCYHTTMFDFHSDQPLLTPERLASENDILLFDGVFLMRPELASVWDMTIFVQVAFETALQRAMQRDIPLFGSAQIVMERYQKRYFPAQQYYLQTCHPAEQADIVIDNNLPDQPFFVREIHAR
jgi:uridine kinase